jgi:uncharacterized MAPEG superfamily protein
MTPELTALTLAALLQVVQLVLMAVPANRDLGPDYTAGPRDTPPPRPLSPLAGRLQRALANHFEALILFAIAVAVVTLSGQSTSFTAACAWTYLAARILYVPAYALGLAPWRSVVWGVGLLATVAMLIAALL